MTLPFRRGDMVWSYFPFTEAPDHPAAQRHASILMGVFSAVEGGHIVNRPIAAHGLSVAVYTSSRTAKFGSVLPVGVIQVPVDRARQNNNRTAFFIDTRIRAYLPLHRSYFPDLDRPDHGVIASLDVGLFRQVMSAFAEVNARAPEQIVNVGPLRPR